MGRRLLWCVVEFKLNSVQVQGVPKNNNYCANCVKFIFICKIKLHVLHLNIS